MKLSTGSLKVAVTVKVVFVYASTVEVNTTVGTAVSFLITYVLELTGHPQVSDILISILLIPSIGVNPVDTLDPILVRLPPLFLDISTLIGDGPHELFILQVIAHA